ncbi:winged helix-turn-helix domain-containing protein [Streptomyces sp. NPDC021100]|uniref:winged helix-turn-helix domain-containing protein n=1 Tax=Streptomyces sp. NPDC021100 TaxID=3365114 RepID=UPI0037BC3F05
MPREPLASPALPMAGVDVPLHLPAVRQWLTTTSGRIATDGYSWMQAVYWFHLDSTYTTGRTHGPRRVGETTVRVAVELARLSPCRPGVAYLSRVLRLSERTVQYHLAILRETGLLTYRTKGTRVRGAGRRASEFVCTIPPVVDAALHLRTDDSEQYIRRVCGIGDKGRPLMKRLAKMAKRALRRPRRAESAKRFPARPNSPTRCTPMGGSASGSSSAGSPTSPSESKLEAGKDHITLPKKTGTPRRLNAVGRRYRLAAELIRQVPWLHRASVPRIAWILKDVSDAGWTVAEVMAVLGLQAPARTVRRPSGFLARRLLGAHLLYDTPAKRANLVAWWRDSRQAEIDRHVEWEGVWQAPRGGAVARLVRQAIGSVRHGSIPAEQPEQTSTLELTDDERTTHRQTAQQAFLSGEPGLVTSAVDIMGREAAEAFYGPELVARALRLAGASGHLTVGVGR